MCVQVCVCPEREREVCTSFYDDDDDDPGDVIHQAGIHSFSGSDNIPRVWIWSRLVQRYVQDMPRVPPEIISMI